ncbi:MAG: hypothetical protein KKF89_00180 [Nanoarchaeota archaeon]|nr:hypothetical protein [Nanoarchaeota archaeon]MBU1854113.1 hypothetical protein [Nanoarchaeota archaeon]
MPRKKKSSGKTSAKNNLKTKKNSKTPSKSCCSLKGPWNRDKTALVLSIIPGLGQLYKKDWVDFFAIYFGFLVALWCWGVKNILPEEMFWYSFLNVLGWIILLGTYAWNLVDAYRS